jgi:hypothetical protein
MDAALKAMQALIASRTELFPTTVESLEEEETSSSYSDLTHHQGCLSRRHDGIVPS